MNYITNLPTNGTFNVTAYFGQENVKYWKNGHKGIDITGDKSLYSICDGTVKVVGWDADGWGQYVSIEPTGFPRMRFILCHMVKDSVKVKVGQKVSRTTLLGTMGTTGNSSGVHVHVECRIDNVSVDPTAYLGIANKKANGLNSTDFKTTEAESNKILQQMLDKKDGKSTSTKDYKSLYENEQKKVNELNSEVMGLSAQIKDLSAEIDSLNKKIKNAKAALK